MLGPHNQLATIAARTPCVWHQDCQIALVNFNPHHENLTRTRYKCSVKCLPEDFDLPLRQLDHLLQLELKQRTVQYEQNRKKLASLGEAIVAKIETKINTLSKRVVDVKVQLMQQVRSIMLSQLQFQETDVIIQTMHKINSNGLCNLDWLNNIAETLAKIVTKEGDTFKFETTDVEKQAGHQLASAIERLQSMENWENTTPSGFTAKGSKSETLEKGEPVRVFEQVRCMALTQDCSILALAKKRGYIELWDFQTMNYTANIYSRQLLTDMLYSIDIFKEFSLLATGGTDQVIKIWKLPSLQSGAQEFKEVQPHQTFPCVSYITKVQFYKTISALFLFASEYEKKLTIWNLSQVRLHLVEETRGQVNNFVICQDGKLVVAVDSAGFCYLKKLEHTKQVQIHRESVLGIDVDKYEQLVITSGCDMKIKLWRLQSLLEEALCVALSEIQASLPKAMKQIYSWNVKFEPTQNKIYSAIDQDIAIRVYTVDGQGQLVERQGPQFANKSRMTQLIVTKGGLLCSCCE